MSTAPRRNRKAENVDIIRLNCLGYSLTTIAARLKCHASSIALRLKSLKIAPSDTRRTFMEDVYNSMEPGLVDTLADMLANAPGGPKPIKQYVAELVAADVNRHIAENMAKEAEEQTTAIDLQPTGAAAIGGLAAPVTEEHRG